jgi:hypothetical protein
VRERVKGRAEGRRGGRERRVEGGFRVAVEGDEGGFRVAFEGEEG